MIQFKKSLNDTWQWAIRDFKEYPLRFVLEILAWLMSIGCAVALAVTVPNPPWLILYPTFIIQCGVFAWASWSRGSVGMLSNYLLLVAIDTVALIRIINIQ
jgi:hypothetical protein